MLKDDSDSSSSSSSSAGSCSILGIIMCRLQHAATQTLWPLMLPLHLLLQSLLSAISLPLAPQTRLNSLSPLLSLTPPLVSRSGVVRLTMSTLPAQWASAIVVGGGDYAFTGESPVAVLGVFELTHPCVCCSRALLRRSNQRFVGVCAVCRQQRAGAVHACRGCDGSVGRCS